MSDSNWGDWWFLNGGFIHRVFKYRQWTQLKDLALSLPKAAWDEQQKKINAAERKLGIAKAALASISGMGGVCACFLDLESDACPMCKADWALKQIAEGDDGGTTA